MSHFKYLEEKLFIENISVRNVAKRNKTPFYLYSEQQIKNNYLNFEKIFKNVNPLICFAAKANTNLTIMNILGKLGSKLVGISIGKKALKAGIEKIGFDRGGYLYHGRVKSLAEGAREAGLKF